MMQLCVPKLRTSTGLKNFNTAMARFNYDLQEWRERCAHAVLQHTSFAPV